MHRWLVVPDYMPEIPRRHRAQPVALQTHALIRRGDHVSLCFDRESENIDFATCSGGMSKDEKIYLIGDFGIDGVRVCWVGGVHRIIGPLLT